MACTWGVNWHALNATIEERLAALEAAVAELRDHRLIQPVALDWIEQVIGSFQDEPAFDERLLTAGLSGDQQGLLNHVGWVEPIA
jgi:hypothetical protein